MDILSTIFLWLQLQNQLYPQHNKVVGGYIDFTQSFRPSVHPSVLYPVSAL